MFDVVSIKDVKLSLGEWCKTYRKQNQLSQEALADNLNLSRITIQKLENGNNVTIDTLLKVAYHFDKLQIINQYLKTDIDNANVPSLY